MLDFLVHLSSWLSGSPTYMLQNGAYAPKKEMLREQAPGLDPASQSQPGHQGSPSTKGWFSPSWLLTAPVAGHSYLIWGKYALGSLWDGGMALYFPTPWLDVLWTASPRSTFKVQSASLSMVSHTLELSHLTNYSDPSLNGTVQFPALNGTEKEKIIKGVSSGHIDLFYTPLEAPWFVL